MSQPTRLRLNSVLLGDELGHIKLVQLGPEPDRQDLDRPISPDVASCSPEGDAGHDTELDVDKKPTTSTTTFKSQRHRIVRILDVCLQKEPAASRAIISIRPIENVFETYLDTTAKPNNLYLIANKVGQIFVCNTKAVQERLYQCLSLGHLSEDSVGTDDAVDKLQTHIPPMLSPIYYNMNSKVPVCGSQPINQTNILVVYQNGDIQHVSIGQDILQSSLMFKRKTIKMLGLGYNSDAKAVHWRIDGATGLCYFDSDTCSGHLDENDPLTDIVLSSPTHKLGHKRSDMTQQKLYNQSPCIKSRKHNAEDRLVPTQVINMITSRTDQYKPTRICKWSSITSLNLIYRKLALYDLVGSENFERSLGPSKYQVNCYKLNDNRLAVGGSGYALRVYDVQAQKAFWNCRTGVGKNPLFCPQQGEPHTIGDIDWLGGNKTTKKTPSMLATCSGIDSVVNVYDLRSYKPVFHLDLTDQTESRWKPYDNHPRGCMFTRICASGAPYSTAVPSQQLALGSTNGQMHLVDLRFVAKSRRLLGRLPGFCGGSVKDIRFVSESFDTSRIVSCAADRFVRIYKMQTSFTSVISHKLTTKVFLGTRPTCIQPVCDEITQSYLSSVLSRYGSLSNISTIDSGQRPG